ncbi:MAG: DUF3175 domain-containing protein [Nitrospiraceae bacterium]
MAHRLKQGKPKSNKPRKWSAEVMKRSDALDLERGVFMKTNPRQIASSLKRSALQSRRRKGTPYQSAMSMLNFHINRSGKHLTPAQKRKLERAKDELRALFGKTQDRRFSSSLGPRSSREKGLTG